MNSPSKESSNHYQSNFKGKKAGGSQKHIGKKNDLREKRGIDPINTDIKKNYTTQNPKDKEYKEYYYNSARNLQISSISFASDDNRITFNVPLENNQEKAIIEDQEIKISYVNKSYFIHVKQNSEFVYLCASKFNIYPNSVYAIGNFLYKAHIENNAIILAKEGNFMYSEDVRDRISSWIIREADSKTQGTFGIKSTREIVSCSGQLIKKQIYTKDIDSEGYCYPLKIERNMKVCFKNKIYLIETK